MGCREGHEGERCQLCAEGYVGDPTGEITGVSFLFFFVCVYVESVTDLCTTRRLSIPMSTV